MAQTQPLPAVVTIFDLPTTASVPVTALLEVQFTSAGVATTVGVSFSQLATSIVTSFIIHGNSVLGVAGNATAAALPIVAATNGQVLQLLAGNLVFASPPAGLQRSVATAGNATIATTDSILNFNLVAPLTVTVPAASGRNGLALRFKDAAQNFGTNNLTLNRTGSDTFDNATTILLDVNGQVLTLVPYSDGVNSGYGIE